MWGSTHLVAQGPPGPDPDTHMLAATWEPQPRCLRTSATLRGRFRKNDDGDGDTVSVIYYSLRAPVDYVGGVGARGPPSPARSPSRSLSLRLKSHCSCELFSPLIRSLSYKMKKGYRVRVRTFVCVCMCVCARQEVAHRVRDHGSVPSKPGAGELGYRRASWNASARAGKVALGSETVFHFWFFFFLLFCLVSRRSLVLPTLSCRTSAPSLPLSSSCNVSRLSHFTPVPLSASSSLSH